MSVLNRHKNTLWETVAASGVDPGLLEASDMEDGVFRLAFTPAALTFDVKQASHSFDLFKYRGLKFTPGRTFFRPRLSGRKSVADWLNALGGWFQDKDGWTAGWFEISEVALRFGEWAEEEVLSAVAEFEIPDFWLRASSRPWDPGYAADNSRPEGFSSRERDAIHVALVQFRLRIISEFSPNASVLFTIEERLTYLDRAVERLNRFDWHSVALSTIVTIATALSLDTERGRQLWHIFSELFKVVRTLAE